MLTTFLTAPPRRKLVAFAKGYDARTFARLAGFGEWRTCKILTLEIPLRKKIYELRALDKDASGPVLIVPSEASDVLMRVRDVGLCFDRDTPESEYHVKRLTDALMQVAIKEMEALYEAQVS